MNSKTWLIVFGLFALILIGGAGYYCLGASGTYQEALASWNSTKGDITSLERSVPYPSEENEEKLQASVTEYKEAVGHLFKSLDKFQKKLDTTLQNTEFQQLVKTRVEAFRALASSGGMDMESIDEFHLGFESYANTLPASELVPILHYELEGIDLLLKDLVGVGAEKLMVFSRDAIHGELGGNTKKESGVVHKYPVRLKFRSSHGALQNFINKVANNKEYFYIIRVLKVVNEVKEGPLKPGSGDGAATPKFRNPVTQEVADEEKLTVWGYPDATPAELEASAKAAGFLIATEDARVLMGQESLTVFMIVDIARFLNPDEVSKSQEAERNKAPESKKGSTRKRRSRQ